MGTEAYDLAFLGDADEAFDPSGQQKVDDLSDGEYEFAVRDSRLKILTGKSMAILEMSLEVLSAGKHAGAKVQHALFVKDKDSADRAGRDLAKLGFDCDKWTKANGRPFSQEIQKAPKGLRGLRFYGKKATNKSDGKEYHNLYFVRRNAAGDGRPAVIGPEVLDAKDLENDSPF